MASPSESSASTAAILFLQQQTPAGLRKQRQMSFVLLCMAK
jgi:hypothetical protein